MALNDSFANLVNDITAQVLEQVQQQVQQAPQPAQNTNTSMPNDATLKDVTSLLDQLNKQMGELISHTENIADNSGKQVRVTKGLSNNKFA